jgi:ribosomal protein S18 acetylase RimI-like enzyme
MESTMRRLKHEADYWRIREFLRQVILLQGKQDFCWHVARFDYWRWHGLENMQAYPSLDSCTFIWENRESQIVAVLNPEEKGDAFLHVHPDHHSRRQLEEMVILAEKQLTLDDPASHQRLKVWVNGEDTLLQALLVDRGYIQGGDVEYQRRRVVIEVPKVEVAPGYMVRSLGDQQELPSRSWASWKAFHPDEPDEYYEGWEWYLNIQRIPLYRRDLDLVSVADNGEIAGFCTVWFDDVTRSGYFEPVGVMPAHQRHGLAKALMHEGLNRLKQLGAINAFVGSYEPIAHALYASTGFTEYDISAAWYKTF